MLHLILLESAIELVPGRLTALKDVQSYAGKRGKKPDEVLLDQSYHGRVMTRLPNHEKRGRPDITFLTLISVLETPLCKEGLLSVYIHLQDGRIIEVNPEVRLPRNYDRFIGLMEQLLVEGQVPPRGDPLLRITQLDLEGLLADLKGDSSMSILAEEEGTKITPRRLKAMIPEDSSKSVIFGVGAFPHGDLARETVELFDEVVRLDMDVMMAWHVSSMMLWLYSEHVAVADRRFGSTPL
ncbi:MAG: 16S rRNA methyltransferase [Candidatus Lokiarchaeota archaeon]|nr:16S rRNA methyltransferase [Candidatus Lokiarchaeota archaeon]